MTICAALVAALAASPSSSAGAFSGPYSGSGELDKRARFSFRVAGDEVLRFRARRLLFRCEGRRDRRRGAPALGRIRLRRGGNIVADRYARDGRFAWSATVRGSLSRSTGSARGRASYRLFFGDGDTCRSARRSRRWSARRAGLIFTSGFEGGVQIAPPHASNGLWRYPISGADRGYDWQSSFPGNTPGAFFPLVDESQPVRDYAEARIDSVSGPAGPTRALYMDVKREGRNRKSQRVRNQFPVDAPAKRGYVSYRMRLQPNLGLTMPPHEQSWRRIFVLGNSNATGYKVTFGLHRLALGPLRWEAAGTRLYSGQPRARVDWIQRTAQPRVPTDRWFRLEMQWLQDPADGRFRAWVDGQKVADHRGRTQLPRDPLSPQIFKIYVGKNSLAHGPAYQWIDDVVMARSRIRR